MDNYKALLQLVKDVQDALGTAEEDAALVEVARNAHRSEMELASHFNDEDFDA